MVTKNNDNFNARIHKKNRKMVESSDEEEDSDVYSSEYTESDSESDSDYVPRKRKLAKGREFDDEEEYSEEEDEEEEEEYLEEDDEEDDEDEEDEDSLIDPHELRKTIATLFPSNYIREKIRADEKNVRKKKPVYEKKKKTRRSKRRPVVEEESEEEVDEEESDYDEYYEDNEDDEEDEETSLKDFNILFSALAAGGGQGQNKEDMEDQSAIDNDKNEECDSDDEKRFMSENYQTVRVPEKLRKRREKEKKLAQKKKNRRNKSEKSDSSDIVDAEQEYKELADLKIHLLQQLEKNPNSKMLLKKVEECRDSIRKLVRKSRLKNAKKYYKMIKGEDEGKKKGEIDYFKTQLSNKEQLRVIQELKEINEHISIKKPYRLTLLDSNIPAKFKATVMQKVNMLRSMEPGDPEYYKLKTWVDGFMRIPFGTYKNLEVNIKDGIEVCSDFMENAKKTLDDCVYGLDNAKMQIMQLIGQWITNPQALGTAIAIQGPPGTGKTSLVKEGISKILGREFTFIALGGTGDASTLEGHGYTYEGSMWGRIVQILMDSKCMNPVIYFDELDKVSDTPRGEEIIGILTHLTDTSQNNVFHDKYFSEIHFDLSKCLFIFSYNDESKINPILRDRMYRIITKGYEPKEKAIIARDFILPKIRQQVAFNEEELNIPDDTLDDIINNKSITKEEQGVRNLKRCLEIIHTKLNLFRLMKPEKNIFSKELDLNISFPVSVTKDHVKKLIEYEPINQSLLAMYV